MPKDNKEEKRNFVNGRLQKLLEIKIKANGLIQQLISDINSYYDDAIIKYYSPDYDTNLLNKLIIILHLEILNSNNLYIFR